MADSMSPTPSPLWGLSGAGRGDGFAVLSHRGAVRVGGSARLPPCLPVRPLR